MLLLPAVDDTCSMVTTTSSYKQRQFVVGFVCKYVRVNPPSCIVTFNCLWVRLMHHVCVRVGADVCVVYIGIKHTVPKSKTLQSQWYLVVCETYSSSSRLEQKHNNTSLILESLTNMCDKSPIININIAYWYTTLSVSALTLWKCDFVLYCMFCFVVVLFLKIKLANRRKFISSYSFSRRRKVTAIFIHMHK